MEQFDLKISTRTKVFDLLFNEKFPDNSAQWKAPFFSAPLYRDKAPLRTAKKVLHAE